MSKMRKHATFLKTLAFLIPMVALVGCNGKPNGDGGNGGNGDNGSGEISINEQSIVINNIALLAEPFAFSKTMSQVVATAGGAETTADQMLQSMIDSFAENSFIHPVSGKTITVTPRPLESVMTPADLLNPDSPDGMIPVGLFNRFDLAPADGSNCGEYRIVYAKNSSGIDDRMTMIFEARVPNPNPNQGIAGCSPITDFWAARSGDSSLADTVTELEKLYYQGITGLEPIVKAENYGLPMGQLRVNLFKTPDFNTVRWSLREFLVNFDENGRAIFKPEPVDDSPTAALFREAGNLPGEFDETDLNEFRDAFLEQPLCNLVNPDRLNSSASATDIINGISAGFPHKYNDFESISQGDEDNPAFNTDAQLLEAVETHLAALSDLTGVSETQLMNRAGTMTCGGCHQFSAGEDLGNGATWPASLNFVHIDEAGNLSPLLSDVFIPNRIRIAEHFRENRTPFQQSVPPCPGAVSESESITVSEATASREHALFKDVDTIRNEINEITRSPEAQAESPEKLKTMLPDLKNAVDTARQRESAIPGAYIQDRKH